VIRPLIRVVALAAALPLSLAAQAPRRQAAVLAGGCFWGIQNVYEHVKGVTQVTSGYAGGRSETAEYETVSSGATGHAESVRIVFDPDVVSYATLLKVFFVVAHDPTQLDRQGPDVGPQYRSAIFFATEEQHRIARAVMDSLTRTHAFARTIVTQLAPLAGFFSAESYHQDYAIRHPLDPYILINDRPKVSRLRERLPELFKDEPTRFSN
jgi:peptide-methionine (S)-S-oxide reductase